MKNQATLIFLVFILAGCVGTPEESKLVTYPSISECIDSSEAQRVYNDLMDLSVGLQERETKVEFSMVFRMIELNNLKIIDVSGITASKTDSLRNDLQQLFKCVKFSNDSTSYDLSLRQDLKTLAGIGHPNFSYSNGSLSRFVDVLPRASFENEEFRRMLRLIMLEVYMKEFPENREH